MRKRRRCNVAKRAGPRFMVPTFRSAERGLGLQAAEAIRERMGQDFQLKTLWIVPKSDIMTTLVNSGYSTTEALSSNDARALAQLLRAEEYVEGTVEKDGQRLPRHGEHDAHSPGRHGAAAAANRRRQSRRTRRSRSRAPSRPRGSRSNRPTNASSSTGPRTTRERWPKRAGASRRIRTPSCRACAWQRSTTTRSLAPTR